MRSNLPAPIAAIAVVAYTATCAVGPGVAALRAALAQSRSGLRPNDFGPTPLTTFIGRVDGLEVAALPAHLHAWDCRNNRLAWLGMQADGFIDAATAARDRHGPTRVALVLGTSTSSIGETEAAYTQLDADGGFPAEQRRPLVHTPHALGLFLQQALGLAGPCVTLSTACSSSAKVFASAERLLRMGLADAVVVGGVDTLCGSVLFGFNSLELVSPTACRPFDAERDGISLGEAAGFALLERNATGQGVYPRLLGYGEASDAHHMSTPHPEGLGAERALDDALARAGLGVDAIDYINLHGTASTKNDEVEAALVARRFGPAVHASSTKGFTGHTLGAAGIVEAVVGLLALETGVMPGNLNAQTLDPVCGPQVQLLPAEREVRVVLSNSFGFGGNNCALLFGQPVAGRAGDTAGAAEAAAPMPSAGAAAPRRLYIEGPAFWAPTLPGWDVARAVFRGERPLADPPAKRPSPQVLPPAERRRAPDSVALALEVASASIAAAGRDPQSLPCVFASAHGDLAINDYMCSVLAADPLLLSPTKFHNSVHNAPVGYWTIATGCMQASNSLTAFERSFAAGLLEAATQAAADERPVLLVAYDVQAVGALASITRSDGLLAVALVIAPERTERSIAVIDWQLVEGDRQASEPRSDAARSVAGNAMADALPWFEALANDGAVELSSPVSATLSLQAHIAPLVRQED